MVFEKRITTYACSICQMTYSQKEDAQKCELLCNKLSKSPEISILGLNSRTYNILKIAGIDSVEDALGLTANYLLNLKGFGQGCLENLHQRLQLFVGQKESLVKLRDPLKGTNTKRNARRRQVSKIEPLFESDEWTNREVDLPELLKKQITQFVDSQNWVSLYKDYRWNCDTWENGFPDVLRLETQMRCSRQNGQIKRKDILDVVNWSMYNYSRNITSPDSIPIDKEDQENDGKISLLQALITLEQNVRGLEATCLTKALRFAFPNRAGTLDSRIVRVFGIGDPNVKSYQWLSIRTHKLSSVWVISRNRMWYLEYEKWLQILMRMVTLINDKGVTCPHPRKFLDAGLRSEGVWICADVEMAIYTYLTGVLEKAENK